MLEGGTSVELADAELADAPAAAAAADSCLARSRSRAVVNVSLTWLIRMGLRRIEFARLLLALYSNWADLIASDSHPQGAPSTSVWHRPASSVYAFSAYSSKQPKT